MQAQGLLECDGYFRTEFYVSLSNLPAALMVVGWATYLEDEVNEVSPYSNDASQEDSSAVLSAFLNKCRGSVQNKG